MLRDREMGVLIHVCDYFSRYICDAEMQDPASYVELYGELDGVFKIYLY